MKKLALISVLVVPAFGDSFLTSVTFYSSHEIGEMETPEQVVAEMGKYPDIMHHMAVLQAAYFLDLNGIVGGSKVIDLLKAKKGTATGNFDLGFAMVMLEFDPDGLDYLGKATSILNTPEAHLGYGLCIAQIDAFAGDGAENWDRQTDLKKQAINQLVQCLDMDELWASDYTGMTLLEAVDYMGYYEGYLDYPEWKKLMKFRENYDRE